MLVIDDWAMAPLAETERRDFWEICEDRYQTRSTILTSQLPVARWHEQILGGHLKTGHTWSLQNRPTKLSQDKSIYNPPTSRFGKHFSQSSLKRVYTGETWAEDTATQGCDRSADPGAGIRRAVASSPRRPSNPGGKR